MDLRFNTHYAANSRSGEITLFEADQSGLGDFVAGSLEASTTDLATEFNNMIIAQQSFAMNGQSFRTIDAMAQTAHEETLGYLPALAKRYSNPAPAGGDVFVYAAVFISADRLRYLSHVFDN